MRLPRKRSILIVADGPSAACLRTEAVPQEVYVLAVNNAVIWLPRVNAYMTAAPNVRQRLNMRNRRMGVRYFAAVPPAYGSSFAEGDMALPREPNVSFLTAVERHGLETDPEKCAAGNSCFAALNLAAAHMQAERVAIVGLDGDDRPRVSGGKPGDLSHLPDLFASYDGNAEVVNGSPRSLIEAFPKMSASEAISWLL